MYKTSNVFTIFLVHRLDIQKIKMTELEQEKSTFPQPDVMEEVIEMVKPWESMQFIPGEKIIFKELKPQGFKVVDTTAVEDSPDDDSDEPYDDKARATMRLCVDPNTSEDHVKKVLKDAGIDTLKYEMLSCENENDPNVSAFIAFEYYDMKKYEIIESPFYDMFWNKHMGKVIKEGVCFSKSRIPDDLRDSLRKNLDKLAKETEIDFHPNSNDVVRDLVHPALFSYIEGVSELKQSEEEPKAKKVKVKKSKSEESKDEEAGKFDFWGRPYERSKFQWLPAPFFIAKDGKCSIQEYINNLDKAKFPELYGDLEKLFDIFLPFFEDVWAYAKAMCFYTEGLDVNDDGGFYDNMNEAEFGFQKPDIKFRDHELQVITKIVDYTLQPGQSYEGVWHAEGMSHENIVMTGMIKL